MYIHKFLRISGISVFARSTESEINIDLPCGVTNTSLGSPCVRCVTGVSIMLPRIVCLFFQVTYDQSVEFLSDSYNQQNLGAGRAKI